MKARDAISDLRAERVRRVRKGEWPEAGTVVWLAAAEAAERKRAEGGELSDLEEHAVEVAAAHRERQAAK